MFWGTKRKIIQVHRDRLGRGWDLTFNPSQPCSNDVIGTKTFTCIGQIIQFYQEFVYSQSEKK